MSRATYILAVNNSPNCTLPSLGHRRWSVLGLERKICIPRGDFFQGHSHARLRQTAPPCLTALADGEQVAFSPGDRDTPQCAIVGVMGL